jgi:hypothetical protein
MTFGKLGILNGILFKIVGMNFTTNSIETYRTNVTKSGVTALALWRRKGKIATWL